MIDPKTNGFFCQSLSKHILIFELRNTILFHIYFSRSNIFSWWCNIFVEGVARAGGGEDSQVSKVSLSSSIWTKPRTQGASDKCFSLYKYFCMMIEVWCSDSCRRQGQSGVQSITELQHQADGATEPLTEPGWASQRHGGGCERWF